MTAGQAAAVLPGGDLTETAAFFERLGFRTEGLIPADGPRVVKMSGHGMRLHLDRSLDPAPSVLELRVDDPSAVADGKPVLVGPNGTEVRVVPADGPIALPALVEELVISRLADSDGGGVGRAGMIYRDLLPGRLGGRFIASHIMIHEGGPVPDRVHHHHIRFQMLFCQQGWVRVVYEDQGDSFVLHPGDAVLQPPHIRHRVLESSDYFEIVEIGCPAEHDTLFDHDMSLPTASVDVDRDFAGQRFCRHIAGEAEWVIDADGFERSDLGIAAATSGLAGATVLRAAGVTGERDEVGRPFDLLHRGELAFRFVVAGSTTMTVGGTSHELERGDAITIPAGMAASIDTRSPDFSLLEVILPGRA